MNTVDIDAVHRIETDSFSDPWSKNAIFEDFNKTHSIYFVAEADKPDQYGVVAGYAGMWHLVNEGHINNLAVAEDHRRNGVGSMLMEALVEAGIRLSMIGLTLEVRVGNRAAMGLYHKHGFKAEGYRKNYYSQTREDAVIMWKYF